MKITTVTVTYGGKLNLGNYQSAEISAELGAEIETHEDVDEVARLLFDQCRAIVVERATPLITHKNALVDGVFQSLPAKLREGILEDELIRIKKEK